MKTSVFNELLGRSIWKWNAIPGIREIKMRTVDVGNKPKISFMFMIAPEFDPEDIYDQVHEHLAEDISEVVCLNITKKYN